MVSGQAHLDPTEDSPVLPPRGRTDNPEEGPLLGLGWGRSKRDGGGAQGVGHFVYMCKSKRV